LCIFFAGSFHPSSIWEIEYAQKKRKVTWLCMKFGMKLLCSTKINVKCLPACPNKMFQWCNLWSLLFFSSFLEIKCFFKMMLPHFTLKKFSSLLTNQCPEYFLFYSFIFLEIIMKFTVLRLILPLDFCKRLCHFGCNKNR